MRVSREREKEKKVQSETLRLTTIEKYEKGNWNEWIKMEETNRNENENCVRMRKRGDQMEWNEQK